MSDKVMFRKGREIHHPQMGRNLPEKPYPHDEDAQPHWRLGQLVVYTHTMLAGQPQKSRY